MINFVLRRLGQSAILLVIMSLLVFVGMYVVSDPVAVMAGEDATAADRAALAAAYGLDQPLPVQYLTFLANIVQGDFGTSFVYGRPVLDLIFERLPATLEVVFLAMVLGLAFGIPMGIFSGLNRRKPATRLISMITTIGYSIPNFWQALLFILVFAVWLRVLPATGRGPTTDFLGLQLSLFNAEGLRYMLLPAANLAVALICMQTRLARSGTQEVMYQDYMMFARAKGIAPRRLIGRHLLRNILIPIVTITALELGTLIAFSTVTETVFSWPGIGKLLLDSIYRSDRPVVVAYMILITLMFVLINLAADIIYAVLDPRIRYS
ncbi:ABC transporter permease [Devosia sp. Root436]|jgi:peptide/nickel transport system permease protein|uniref:ABC transporter permease n=1 Tax=Devosia sp. Root436 TaxID=1736537 RepID=UPI0006FF3D5E|nr:ABC transporter permease [Devosia sp. Root436]KQX42968.1 ABC transporter permease [Devosia sp. Root436]